MKKSLIVILLMLVTRSTSAGDDFCGIVNTTFLNGERITFKVFYSVIGLYVDAGTAYVHVGIEKLNNLPTYHIVADGYSNPTYDWIFKVRDKYESIVDSKTLLPYFFSRSINEGSFHQNQTIAFNQKSNEVTTHKGESFKAADCTFDVVSAVYAVRNLDFSNLQVNEKVYLNFFLDNELFPSYFKYLGKEIIQTRFGKFKAIKIAPLLVKGSMFEGGELMTIWVTDDENHIPIRIQTPIIIGSIKVDMKSYQGLRHPLSALIE